MDLIKLENKTGSFINSKLKQNKLFFLNKPILHYDIK